MSAKNGPSVVAAANASTSSSKSRVPIGVTSTTSKFVKHSVGGPSQTSSGTGASGLTSSSSGSSHAAARLQHAANPSSGGRETAAAAGTATKLSRRDSTKSKSGESGRKNSILGWLRHHIGEGIDGGKSLGSSSSSRGVKKKLETAESFARANHLSDSMPSLVIQASIPEASCVTSSRDAEAPAAGYASSSSSSATTVASSQPGDIVVNYRVRKNLLPSVTSDDGYGVNGRVKPSGAVRTLSGRNRWSSYELTGTAGGGMPLVTVEDSDESNAGDDDQDQRNSSASVGMSHHMLMDATVGSRARSVEALHIAGAVVKVHSSAGIKQQHACSSADLPSESTLATSSGLLASSTSIDDQTSSVERIQVNGCAENDPIGGVFLVYVS